MTYVSTIDALADSRRRSIFETLRQRPRTVAEITAEQPVSQPAVSQHLKVLLEAGLVHVRKEGRRHYYSVRPEGLAELKQWVDSFWDDVLASFATRVEQQTGEDDANQN